MPDPDDLPRPRSEADLLAMAKANLLHESTSGLEFKEKIDGPPHGNRKIAEELASLGSMGAGFYLGSEIRRTAPRSTRSLKTHWRRLVTRRRSLKPSRRSRCQRSSRPFTSWPTTSRLLSDHGLGMSLSMCLHRRSPPTWLVVGTGVGMEPQVPDARPRCPSAP